MREPRGRPRRRRGEAARGTGEERSSRRRAGAAMAGAGEEAAAGATPAAVRP